MFDWDLNTPLRWWYFLLLATFVHCYLNWLTIQKSLVNKEIKFYWNAWSGKTFAFVKCINLCEFWFLTMTICLWSLLYLNVSFSVTDIFTRKAQSTGKFRISHRRCSVKKAVLKNFAVFTGLKRDFNTSVFLWILRNFKTTYFEEHLQTAMVSCLRFIWITNSSDHRRVWTANLLHTK